MQEKQRCMILLFSISLAFLISSAGALLASKKSKNIFTVGKMLQLSADHHAGWSLCKLWEDRFSVSDLVSPPPRPWRVCTTNFHSEWMECTECNLPGPSISRYLITPVLNIYHMNLMQSTALIAWSKRILDLDGCRSISMYKLVITKGCMHCLFW